MIARGLGSESFQVTVDGISGELALGLEAGRWEVRSQGLSARKVDVGFPVTNLSAALHGQEALLRFSDVRAQTLGGDLQVDVLGYPLDEAPGEFLVRASALELAAVLALEGGEVTGEGVLDGELPVRLHHQQ